MNFSLRSYLELLRALQSRGYRVTDFHQVEPARAELVLRHDVDMTLESAVRMARAEAAEQLAACYFVLVRTEIYNLFSSSGTEGLREIAALGHEIGLHFDASCHPGADQATLDRECERECQLLETWLERPIRVVSFHRPAPAFLGSESAIAERIHCYQPRFFREMGYCSDSRGGWHHGHPLDHECLRAGRALQLLTHPVWWDGEGHETPVERLDRFCAAQATRLQEEVARNCAPYSEALSQRRRLP